MNDQNRTVDLDTYARQAAAGLRRSVGETELATTAPHPSGGRRLVLVAVTLVVLVGGFVVLTQSDDGSDEGGIASTGQATPLAPSALPDGMAFTGAFEGPIEGVDPQDITVYAGPISSGISLVGYSIVDPLRPAAGAGGEPEISSDGDRHSSTWLDEPTGRTITLSGRGLTPDQMRAAVERTSTDGGGVLTIADDVLPAGVRRIGTVPLGVAGPNISALAGKAGAGGIGYADEGQERVLEVAFAVGEPGWLDAAAVWMDDATAVEVRGEAGYGGGVGSGLPGNTLVWVEPDGTFVRLVGFGLSLDELVEVAESLEPLTPEEWQAMLDQSDSLSADSDADSSSGTAMESRTTFSAIGEPVGVLRFEPVEGTDQAVLRIHDEPNTELVVDPTMAEELPYLGSDRWMYGVVPADTERLVIGTLTGEYETTSFVHIAGGGTYPLWAYLIEMPDLGTSYVMTAYLEDGSEVTRSVY